MDSRKYARGEGALAERLRREAVASRPAFSEELYQRICLVIEQDDPPSPPREQPSRSGGRVWMALAATLLLAGTVLLAWRLNSPEIAPPQVAQPKITQPENSANDTSLALMSQELDGLSDVTQRTADGALRMDSALTTEGWAYLDHDARLATELVLDQLPLDMLASSEDP